MPGRAPARSEGRANRRCLPLRCNGSHHTSFCVSQRGVTVQVALPGPKPSPSKRLVARPPQNVVATQNRATGALKKGKGTPRPAIRFGNARVWP